MADALLLVDVQINMLEPPNPVRNNKEIRAALESLLRRARSAGAFVVHVQNDGKPGDPDEPETPGWNLAFQARNGELVVRKTQSDAFTNDNLVRWLEERKVDSVVVAGMQSNYCVEATCRGALQHHIRVTLASGAHATYDEGKSAVEISADVERELRSDGVKVFPAENISFS